MENVVASSAYSSLLTIENTLERLREIALITNFRDLDSRKRFLFQFLIIKNRYAETEESLSKEPVKRSNSSELNKYLSRPIHHRQMAGWISKLKKNIQAFTETPHNDNETLDFIRQQYGHLQVVIKVLNGDAFFVGCE